MRKGFLSIMAVLIILVPFGELIGTTQVVGAQEIKGSELNIGVNNLTFIENSDSKLEYIYEDEGNTYKVVENFNNDRTSVSSKIFIYNQKSEKYELEDEFITTLEEDKGVVTQSFDGIEETIKLDDINSSGEINLIDESQNGVMLAAKKAPSWKYWSTSKGSSKFKRWTIAAITIVISGITKVPAAAKVVVNLANVTFQMGTKVIYYTSKIYKDTNSSKMRPTFKKVTDIYSDSARKKILKKGITATYKP